MWFRKIIIAALACYLLAALVVSFDEATRPEKQRVATERPTPGWREGLGPDDERRMPLTSEPLAPVIVLDTSKMNDCS